MHLSPVDGGCWFCHVGDNRDMWFCHEFDTWIHEDCLRNEFEKTQHGETDPETAIILDEFKRLAEAKKWKYGIGDKDVAVVDL